MLDMAAIMQCSLAMSRFSFKDENWLLQQTQQQARDAAPGKPAFKKSSKAQRCGVKHAAGKSLPVITQQAAGIESPAPRGTIPAAAQLLSLYFTNDVDTRQQAD